MKRIVLSIWFIVLYIGLQVSCSIEKEADEIRIPFALENNRIVLDAVVNRQSGRFVFDSGIMHSSLGVSAWGLLPVGYEDDIFRNGKLYINLIYGLNKIQFGDTELKTHSWLKNRSDTITYLKEHEGYDGILGIRTFEGYWCELSFSNQEIILHKEKPEVYTNYTPLKALSKYDSLYVPMTIDGTVYHMNIDTGLQHAFFFPQDIIKQKTPSEYREIISNEEVQRYYMVKTNSLSILDEEFNNVSIMTNSYSAQRRNFASLNDMGLIGINFLKHYDLLFDYRELRKGKTTGMYYIPIVPSAEREYGFFSFMKDVPSLGILNFGISDYGLEIISLLTDSIAYKDYDLRPGSVIAAINNKPITDYTYEELTDPLLYEKVEVFSILHEGNEKTVTIRN